MVQTTDASGGSTCEVDARLATKYTPGSLCEVKQLWEGGKDKQGHKIWLQSQPYESEELNDCVEV